MRARNPPLLLPLPIPRLLSAFGLGLPRGVRQHPGLLQTEHPCPQRMGLTKADSSTDRLTTAVIVAPREDHDIPALAAFPSRRPSKSGVKRGWNGWT
jgi:hypothetical protein